MRTRKATGGDCAKRLDPEWAALDDDSLLYDGNGLPLSRRIGAA